MKMNKKILAVIIGIGSFAFSLESYANTPNKKPNIISMNEANKIVLTQTANGQILKSELDNENGTLVYEVDILENNRRKEFVVDASSGKILRINDDGRRHRHHNYNMEPNHSFGPNDPNYGYNNRLQKKLEVKLSTEDAKKIALANSKNGAFKSVELDIKKGIPVYEVEVQEGPIEKEFIIDAVNGNILKVKRDI